MRAREAGGDGCTVTNRDKWLHGGRMRNALHPKREKSTGFHDTFVDFYDEPHESNHENDGARWFMLRQPEVGAMWWVRFHPSSRRCGRMKSR